MTTAVVERQRRPLGRSPGSGMRRVCLAGCLVPRRGSLLAQEHELGDTGRVSIRDDSKRPSAEV